MPAFFLPQKYFMKKLFFLSAYFFLLPFQLFADFNDVLPSDRQIDGNLPTGDAVTHFIPRVIDILIKSAYTIDLAILIYAAFLYFLGHGDDGDYGKAKTTFIYSVVGFLIISISYAIVTGVTMLTWKF